MNFSDVSPEIQARILKALSPPFDRNLVPADDILDLLKQSLPGDEVFTLCLHLVSKGSSPLLALKRKKTTGRVRQTFLTFWAVALL